MSAGDGGAAGTRLGLRSLVRDAVVAFLEDGVAARGAALAYYVLLSLGPLLAFTVAGLGLFLADRPVRPVVVEQIGAFAGPRAGEIVGTVIAEIQRPSLLTPTAIAGALVLLFGATAVFANLRGSLDEIWGVQPDVESYRDHLVAFFVTRVRAALVMAVTGLILAVSFVVTTGFAVVVRLLEGRIPFEPLVVQALDAAASIVVFGALFGALFRVLPSVRIEWSSIWVGSFLTATLFVIGKAVIGFVIAAASWTTYYGPGAAVVAFLFWIYLSAQIFFFGAELIQALSRHRGGALAEQGPEAS